jgi:NAD(P)H-flavin reductase
MHKILHKETLGPNVHRYRIDAPDIAKRRKAGQFVIIRVSDPGERIPLTIADADPVEGSITLIVQAVGKTTIELASKKVGDSIPDVVGPLGQATHIEKVGTVLIVGGGIGIAPIYPITQAHKAAGNHIITIIGARSKNLLIMEEDMRALSDEFIVMTDDGSYGEKGLVTDAIKKVHARGTAVAECVAIGPPVMMKFVSLLTKELGIPTVVSLNPIMIDGTGMCGGCRVTVGGKTRFVCVDGPEFDGHQVDFDEMMKRLGMYKAHECRAVEQLKKQRPEVTEGLDL